MTGPEHYQHAERLLDMASDDECGSEVERFHQAQAQVHATLALTAATMQQHRRTDAVTDEWAAVLT